MRCLLAGGPYDGAHFAVDGLLPECWWVRDDPEQIGIFGLLAGTRPNGGERYVLSGLEEAEAVYQHESVKTNLRVLEGVA